MISFPQAPIASTCRPLVIGLTVIFFFSLRSLSSAADSYQRSWLTYGGFDQRDAASAIAVDSVGNPYLVGSTDAIYGTSTSSFSGTFVSKFDARGNRIWQQQVESGHTRGVAVDATNNVLLASETAEDGPRVNTDGYLLKIDSAGSEIWNQRFGLSSNNDFVMDVAIDAQESSYLAGATFNITGAPANIANGAYLIKHDASGGFQWVRSLGNLGSYAASVAIAPDQSVYVAGQSRTSFLAKFDTDGNIVWDRVLDFSSVISEGTFATNCTTDHFGNIYVVGQTNRPINELRSEAFVAKYDPTGDLIWNRIVQGDAEVAFGNVAVDSVGNVFAAGSIGRFLGTAPNSDNYDAMWAKFDSGGNILWSERFGSPGDDYLSGIALDSFGHVYLAGGSLYTINDFFQADADAFVARYDLIPEPHSIALLLAYLIVSVTHFRRLSLHIPAFPANV